MPTAEELEERITEEIDMEEVRKRILSLEIQRLDELLKGSDENE